LPPLILFVSALAITLALSVLLLFRSGIATQPAGSAERSQQTDRAMRTR
jgi:hypothetical protein